MTNFKQVSSKIQIVSFSFPPMPGIGARRWAKFSKYFSNAGVDFRVIGAMNQSETQSIWMNDIAAFKDRVSYLDSKYPFVLSEYPKSIADKLQYRYCIQRAKRLTKGNYFDKSIYWINTIRKEVIKNYREGYTNLIISGAPFHQMEIVNLKKQCHGLKVFLDFRDPWVANRTAYGFESLSMNRQAYEIELEKSVVSEADVVVSVAQKMADYFSTVGAKRSICIPNGFDPDDYNFLQPKIEPNIPLKCIFAGSLYNQLDTVLEEFLKNIEGVNKNSPNRIEFTFLGVVPAWFKDKAKCLDGIYVSESVSKELALKEINSADFGMLFLTEDINYSISTKMLDYIALNKPILCFSKSKSITGQLIVKRGLGHAIEIDSIKSKLSEVINNRFEINHSEAVKMQDEFNIKKLTSTWLNLIQEIN